MQSLKQDLFNKCVDYVEQRISNAQQAVEDSQSSANSETKSTAGDKHDTARAMMQLAAEQNAKHLAEANKLKKVLRLINPEVQHTVVELGSLVIASNGRFYLSISVGKIELDGDVYYALSPTSPMGQLLMGCHKDDQVRFDGRAITITAIY